MPTDDRIGREPRRRNPNFFDKDDEDDGYAIMLDMRGPHRWNGRNFTRMSQLQYNELVNKKFPARNALGLTTLTVKEHDMVMKKNSKMKSPVNKFYVGASHIASATNKGVNLPNMYSSLDEAINEAKSKITNGSECEIVVSIVAIVTRDVPPIRVRKV